MKDESLMEEDLKTEVAFHFPDRLHQARAIALENGESFASYLRGSSTEKERYRRLAVPLEKVTEKNGITLTNAILYPPQDPIASVLTHSCGIPVLDVDRPNRLLGVITLFYVL